MSDPRLRDSLDESLDLRRAREKRAELLSAALAFKGTRETEAALFRAALGYARAVAIPFRVDDEAAFWDGDSWDHERGT